ncbi:MAG: cysteine desulfurase CsdA [Chlamydiae bacterium CG10_big_fil_rev_8_21_14_0_10_42_34]|nr:MAG: cysteine desulfurase CsdA [Chlamydiae bacterium CG10_big_fil_rev_8_21_14_0_10_42_34]
MRDEFPIFKKHPNLIYLDSAATAHKPKCVIDALTKFYSEDYATVHRAIYKGAIRSTEQYNETRETAARFLNASADEIVFTRGTTDAINLVAQSYARNTLKPEDEILISEMEHHSNMVPWQIVAKQTGAALKIIEVDERGVLQWENSITPKTKIVALAHVSNVTGTMNPIAEIGKAAHAVGAKLLVDGAQAAPHIKIDVRALNCDFYAFSGHKCYGPTGVGVLFGKKELLASMPPIQGGGDMIEKVDLLDSTYQSAPLRFEAGTPIIGSVIALKAALEFIEENRHDDTLTAYATKAMQNIPNLKIIGTAPEKGPIITFYIEGIHPLDLATLLDLKDIAIRSGHLCAQPLLQKFGRSSVARVSFGIYNTIEEVDRFVKALTEIVQVFNTARIQDSELCPSTVL